MCVPCVQSKPCPVFCLNLWKRLINLAVKLIYIMPFHVSLIQRRTTPFLGLKVELPADPLKDWAFWIVFYVRPWISPYLSPYWEILISLVYMQNESWQIQRQTTTLSLVSFLQSLQNHSAFVFSADFAPSAALDTLSHCVQGPRSY